MIVEICANSFESAFNAQQAGAHRIELCSELAVGGITPSYGLIEQVMTSLMIPVFVLVRPRSGDFNYSDAEFKIIKKDIELCKKLGCSGIVSGVLNRDNSIDILRTQELVELAKPLPFVFHRAFDLVPDPISALNELMEIGVQRVLTSGQESTALRGLELIQKLKSQAKNRITILPGGGINLENAIQFKEAGFNEIHCSLSTFHQHVIQPKISMKSPVHFNEFGQSVSDYSKIVAIIKLLQ
jgi:copper homeostasis protein